MFLTPTANPRAEECRPCWLRVQREEEERQDRALYRRWLASGRGANPYFSEAQVQVETPAPAVAQGSLF